MSTSGSISIFYYLPRGKRTLQARISRKGVIVFDKSTGIRVGDGFDKARDFDAGTKRFVKDREANKILSRFENDVYSKYEELKYLYKGEVPDPVFKDSVNGKKLVAGDALTLSLILSKHESMIRNRLLTNKKTGKKLADKTLERYESVVAATTRYLKKHNDFDFSKYNLETQAVVGRDVVKAKYNEFVTSLKNFWIGEGLEDSTVNAYLTGLKHVIEYHLDGIGANLSAMKYSVREKDVYALGEDQVCFVLNNYMEMRAYCDNVGQRHALQYWYTALILNPRKGDMNSWDKNNLVYRDSKTWIRYIPEKTRNSSATTIQILVPGKLMDIFNENLERYRKLLPPLQQTINYHMRRLAAKYEIFRNEIQILKLGKFETVRMCDFMYIHMMRSSGISHKLMSGMAEVFVKETSGHALDSDSFKRYANLTQESKERVVGDYYKTLNL